MDSQVPQLKDIHLPGDPSIWPLALGWWVLLVMLACLFIWLVLKLKKYLNTQKHKRLLLEEFAQLEQKLKTAPSKTHLTETNIFLRRLALAYYPNNKVASLTGNDWLSFLDESGNTQNFSKGAGRILIDAPYRSGELENYNSDEFIPLIRNWVTKTSQKVGGCH